jgi:hypothetical protein
LRVEKLLKRLRREFIKVNFIQAALDSITLFLTLNLVFFLLNITLVSEQLHYRILTAASFIFLLGDWLRRSRRYSLEIYEEENPQLQEILRTARDNIDSQNIVSQAMFDDLMDRARSVTSESIIPGTVILKKIMVVGLLSFLTALSGVADFQPVDETQKVFSQLDPEEFFSEEDEVDVLKNASEIYGEEREVGAISTDLEINITEGASSSEAGEIGSPEIEDFTFESSSPGMPEDVELARQYSFALQKIE